MAISYSYLQQETLGQTTLHDERLTARQLGRPGPVEPTCTWRYHTRICSRRPSAGGAHCLKNLLTKLKVSAWPSLASTADIFCSSSSTLSAFASACSFLIVSLSAPALIAASTLSSAFFSAISSASSLLPALMIAALSLASASSSSASSALSLPSVAAAALARCPIAKSARPAPDTAPPCP